ncbi:MAG: TniQ family protein [Vulcanimicrobiaceae bacterium]
MAGTLWPYHPKPLLDELLSSWIARTAAGNGMFLQAFAIVALGGPIWSGDIDVVATAPFIRMIAEFTATTLDRAHATTVASFGAALPSVMSLRLGSRKRRLYGLQCCPSCLGESPAYFRRAWRFAFVVICPTHRLYLLDRCLDCGRPIHIYQRRLKDLKDPLILAKCSRCECTLSAEGAVSNALLSAKRRMIDTVGKRASHAALMALHNGLVSSYVRSAARMKMRRTVVEWLSVCERIALLGFSS